MGEEQMRFDHEKVDHISEKLKKILRKAKAQGNYELMLEAIETFAFIHCSWNQIYTDLEIEEALQNIRDKITMSSFPAEISRKKTVVFHNGFGVDAWDGLMYIYVKALLALGYQVIHIASVDLKSGQPKFKELVKNENVIFEYYCMEGADRVTQAKDISRIINKYKPEMAFLYLTPWDTAAALAYSWYQGSMTRYLINATDHTFWIGHSAFDICIEFRNYGASLSVKHRHIDVSRLVILPFYPTIDTTKEFEGFPFETDGYKIVFSGGAPYKVYDSNNSFFRLVSSMLEKHEDVIFVYAPKSDELNCKEVKEKFPTRFFLIEKRKDLFQLLKRVYLYLSTYPIGGTLMTQCAVLAGKYPLVAIQNDGFSGTLLGSDERELYYESLEALEEDMDRMLDNECYLKEKEIKLQNRVITEERFVEELNQVIKTGRSGYCICDENYNYNVFEKLFERRFDYNYIMNRAILRDEVRSELLRYFPKQFVKKEVQVMKKILMRAMGK